VLELLVLQPAELTANGVGGEMIASARPRFAHGSRPAADGAATFRAQHFARPSRPRLSEGEGTAIEQGAALLVVKLALDAIDH
jgi:hypothetical protein